MATAADQRRYRTVNQTRRCAAEGCNLFRRRSARLCTLHERHQRHFGHPLAGQIPLATLEAYRFKFAQFIDRHRDTPQARAAIQLCDDMIQHGLPQDVPQWRVKQMAWKRGDVDKRLDDLKQLGVSGREILDRVGGAFLLSRLDPRTLPDDIRLTFRIGMEVLKVRAYPWRDMVSGGTKRDVPGGLVRRVLGSYLRRHLAVFALRVEQGIAAEAKAIVDQAETLATEFAPSTPAPTDQGITS